MGAETIKNVTFMLKNRFKSVQKMDHMFLFSVLVALVCVPWCRCVCVPWCRRACTESFWRAGGRAAGLRLQRSVGLVNRWRERRTVTHSLLSREREREGLNQRGGTNTHSESSEAFTVVTVGNGRDAAMLETLTNKSYVSSVRVGVCVLP